MIILDVRKIITGSITPHALAKEVIGDTNINVRSLCGS